MKVLITGICGFVGSSVAESLVERRQGVEIWGIDNFMRPGSELNRPRLEKLGVHVVHGDIRASSDFEALPAVDWVIDAAANPSVLAGVQGGFSSRQLFEHNLASLVNVLEFSKAHRAGCMLLSTNRVYSIPALIGLPLRVCGNAYELDATASLPPGVSAEGLRVDFSTRPPISLYGSTKLAAEAVALEYGATFDFPVWVNRCGILAGAGQFGRPDQGIVSYWIHAHRRGDRLRYIGFDGTGKQTRDAFHPRDLTALLMAQMDTARSGGQRVYTAGGGKSNAFSLAGLTAWCDARFRPLQPEADLRPRPFDVPWLVMDSHDARRDFGWQPEMALNCLFEQIAVYAERHPEWLEISGV